MITRLPGHNGFVEPVTFLRDGEILATLVLKPEC
jgi:hypothetical protein